MIATLCQRWREQRGTYRPAGEPIDPSRYGVDLVEEREARAFVKQHHYSGTYPAARVRVGLYRSRSWITPELVGCAIFSVPMQPRVWGRYTPGLSAGAGVELGRFVLLDDVPANGETWFLSRALGLLRVALPNVRAVLSYSDPMRRLTASGAVVCPGHVGTIYQAMSARFVGRGKGAWLRLDAEGRTVSRRMLSKLRNDERGAAYAYRSLRAMGAPARLMGEAGPAYVERALAEGPFRRLKHPGNLAYLFPVGSPAQRRGAARGFLPSLPYLKAADAIVEAA